MLGLSLGSGSAPLRVLAVGAHADDIEIGCGGTLMALLLGDRPVEVDWVVCSALGTRRDEASTSAKAFLEGAAEIRLRLGGFRDGYLPYSGGEVKDFFEDLKDIVPDVVFTHSRSDLHQDHRLVSELTWNTFRDHLILEYEIPKYDGDLGAPNVFVPLSETLCGRKIKLLLRGFPSQHGKHWFTQDLFLSLLRLRGMEANSPTSFAEAFYGRKVVLCASS